MTQQEFQHLLNKYSAGNCNPEEIQIVEKWYANIQATDVDDFQDDELENKLWAKIKPQRNLYTGRFFLRVAASIALSAAAFVGFYVYSNGVAERNNTMASTVETVEDGQMISLSNHDKSEKKIGLADGSTIVLQPGSSISYPQIFDLDKRVVHLSGEAFFEVRSDKTRPFYVYSNEIITKVLGTSFTIKAYDGEKQIIVAVKTGKVSVYANPGKQRTITNLHDVILTPNQQVVYNRADDRVSKQIVEKPELFTSEPDFFEMSFDGKPVTEIFEALKENYGIDIVYDADILKDCILTTRMTEEGFHERIDIICKAINAKYTTVDAVVYIESRGCK